MPRAGAAGGRAGRDRAAGRAVGRAAAGCGLRVLALHPNKVAAARDRFRVSGGKSDRFDAFVLCELARTDHHRFRVLEPDSRSDEGDPGADPGAGGSRRRGPGSSTSCVPSSSGSGPGRWGCSAHMDAEILLAFLERYPSPADAHGLGVARMQAFLVRERYSGGQHPRALMAKLRSAPGPGSASWSSRARRQLVLGFVAMIRTLNAQIKRSRAARSERHPRAPRRADLPLAVQVAEERDHRRRAAGRDRRLPRALPHPRRARRRRRPGRRRDRVGQMEDRRLPPGVQQATARRVLPRSRTAAATGTPGPRPLRPSAPRGHEHPRAIRTVGRAWCRVVWQCWRNHAPYDPARHRALQRHITVTIPTPSGPVPDLAATQRMAGAAVTQRAARRAERAALDSKPTSATHRRLTQDVS